MLRLTPKFRISGRYKTTQKVEIGDFLRTFSAPNGRDCQWNRPMLPNNFLSAASRAFTAINLSGNGPESRSQSTFEDLKTPISPHLASGQAVSSGLEVSSNQFKTIQLPRPSVFWPIRASSQFSAHSDRFWNRPQPDPASSQFSAPGSSTSNGSCSCS